MQLHDVDSGTTSPQGQYRWMDVADQLYAVSYRNAYNYTQATVTVDYYTDVTVLYGTLTASNLKANFGYQFKLIGEPEAYPDANERIGLTGRWWQEEWNGSEWANGQNLNNKGDGSSPNPNDYTYWSRRDITDPTSPTGRKYRFTGYLVFDYFITDETGSATLSFQEDDSYHVLWKTSQRGRGSQDGPVKTRMFAVVPPGPVGAYDAAYPQATVGIFGEWERLPPGGVILPNGAYIAQFLLTEESFHGGGLAGGWAAAMGAEIALNIAPDSTPTATLTGTATSSPTRTPDLTATPTLTHTPTPTPTEHRCSGCDATGDRRVDALDIAGFSGAYGSTSGDSNYRTGYDGNSDGQINYLDISYFSGCYGQSW